MSAIDVFVLPSYREGLPVTIVEAMACEKPVIATNIRGCREEVINNVTGLLVPVKDPDALKDAIIRLYTNPDMLDRMGKAGRQRVLESFDEKLIIEQYSQAYYDLISKKGWVSNA